MQRSDIPNWTVATFLFASVCGFSGLVHASRETAPNQARAADAETASLVASAQKAAVAAVTFRQGDAAGFTRARADFTPDGWAAFVKPMQPFLDGNGAPTLTSTFVPTHDATLIGDTQGVLHLRIPGTLTQRNEHSTTTYSSAALEVFAVRNHTAGSNPVSIQQLTQIVCAGGSTACR